ncbi:hypothetical protein H6F50_05450 [Coleofasciculus sp. FACHB-712]|uniref:hypothetical protein n=1 Tax=Coleofasciculus sp. FACHB-712 TaxID=2692789 RepID=UPI0016844D5A|nr:hypothetical protein [Coleofasciculus sp. FACHB-712]MBD1941808.1 hypothetical protein [Coleofasciculus sp. FACHB-712]
MSAENCEGRDAIALFFKDTRYTPVTQAIAQVLTPQSSVLSPQSSVLSPHCSLLTPHPSVLILNWGATESFS